MYFISFLTFLLQKIISEFLLLVILIYVILCHSHRLDKPTKCLDIKILHSIIFRLNLIYTAVAHFYYIILHFYIHTH